MSMIVSILKQIYNFLFKNEIILIFGIRSMLEVGSLALAVFKFLVFKFWINSITIEIASLGSPRPLFIKEGFPKLETLLKTILKNAIN